MLEKSQILYHFFFINSKIKKKFVKSPLVFLLFPIKFPIFQQKKCHIKKVHSCFARSMNPPGARFRWCPNRHSDQLWRFITLITYKRIELRTNWRDMWKVWKMSSWTRWRLRVLSPWWPPCCASRRRRRSSIWHWNGEWIFH